MLPSTSPDMVRQEIYGYLLTHYAISTLICQAATEADINPDTVKFTRTVCILRRTIDPTAFPPKQQQGLHAAITATRNLNPPRRHRTYPRVIKRARPQLLPSQQENRHRHRARRTSHHQARQPRGQQTRGMINSS